MASGNLEQVIIDVSAKNFIVKCSGESTNFLEGDIALISNGTKKIELKRFVDVFVKKSYENYILEREFKKFIRAINEELPVK